MKTRELLLLYLVAIWCPCEKSRVQEISFCAEDALSWVDRHPGVLKALEDLFQMIGMLLLVLESYQDVIYVCEVVIKTLQDLGNKMLENLCCVSEFERHGYELE